MTGRDFIIYILSNKLENESVGLLTVDEYAIKKEVGVDTVYAWIYLDKLDHVWIGKRVFIPISSEVKN